MKEFVSPKWISFLKEQGLDDFDVLWQIDTTLLDEPNIGHGRSGWSSVALLSATKAGKVEKFILKRQQNYSIRTGLHPFRGIPTLRNEATRILEFSRLDIPAMQLAYYAERRDSGGVKAIMLTEYLSGYTSLDALHAAWHQHGWPERSERYRLITSVARVIRSMHTNRFRHNSLYPKHIFVAKDGDEFKVRVIDLEKARRCAVRNAARIRDLDSFNRHTPGWSWADRLRFLQSYCDADQVGPDEKRLCRKILKANSRKGTRRIRARSIAFFLLRKIGLLEDPVTVPESRLSNGASEKPQQQSQASRR